jgi:hypothetical protein
MAVEFEDALWEREHLARGLCPWSGEVLTKDGDGLPGSLSCELCDCFGYDPKDVPGAR